MSELPDSIALIWSYEDVIERAIQTESEDIPTPHQAREILQLVESNHDCNYGVTGDTIDYTAMTYFEGLGNES